MLSNRDYDNRARHDLTGDDLYRYKNGLMSDSELRQLESYYIAADDLKRLQEEEERTRQYNSSSSYGSSSYSGGSSGGRCYDGGRHQRTQAVIRSLENIDKRNHYLDMVESCNRIANASYVTPRKREEARKQAEMYQKKAKAAQKQIEKANKAAKGGSGGGVIVFIIVVIILYFMFNS